MNAEKTIKITAPSGYEIDRSKSTLEEIVFKPIEPVKEKYPMSVDDIKGRKWFVCQGKIEQGQGYTGDLENLKTRELASAFLALMQLKTICDEWNRIDGFVPDWSNDRQVKWGVGFINNNLNSTQLHPIYSHSLVFQDEETAKIFIGSFRELLETAKPLL